jgi:hypothetical protein
MGVPARVAVLGSPNSPGHHPQAWSLAVQHGRDAHAPRPRQPGPGRCPIMLTASSLTPTATPCAICSRENSAHEEATPKNVPQSHQPPVSSLPDNPKSTRHPRAGGDRNRNPPLNRQKQKGVHPPIESAIRSPQSAIRTSTRQPASAPTPDSVYVYEKSIEKYEIRNPHVILAQGAFQKVSRANTAPNSRSQKTRRGPRSCLVGHSRKPFLPGAGDLATRWTFWKAPQAGTAIGTPLEPSKRMDGAPPSSLQRACRRHRRRSAVDHRD